MGDAALSAFLQVLFQNIVNQLEEEVKLELGLEEELKDLMKTVSMIKAALRDAEKRQHEEAAALWLKDLRDLAYDATDILDEYATEVQRRKLISSQRGGSSFLSMAGPKRLIIQHDISHKVKAIKEKIDKTTKRRDAFSSGQYGEGSSHRDHSQPSTLLNPISVFGREEDKKKIVSMLVSSNDAEDTSLSVIPIIGMPGVGKTTVAQIVYNDEIVSRHFKQLLWVHVSHDSNQKMIIKSVIESTDGSLFYPSNSVFQEHLWKKLRGRKYLLVFDDLWNESPEEWEWLSRPLLYGAKGSKILVTTRSELVARTVGTTLPYRLQSLSDDACWSLFCEKAKGTNQQASSDLNMIRDEILKKCQGLPLLAISIGYKLHRENDRNKWRTILKSELSGILGRNTDVMNVIKLSYDRFPRILSHALPTFP